MRFLKRWKARTIGIFILAALLSVGIFFAIWTVKNPYTIASLHLRAYFGDGGAQYLLGHAYMTGCLEPCMDQVLEYVHKYGGIDLSDHVVRQDVKTARKWLHRAAEQDYAEAELELALSYTGVDDAEAARWCLRAANHNDKQAKLIIGRIYEDGRGISRDYVRAYMWYTLARKDAAKDAERVAADANLADLGKKMAERELEDARRQAEDWRPVPAAPPVSRPAYPALDVRQCGAPYYPLDIQPCFF